VAFSHSFKTRPGPAGRPGTRLTRGWNRAGFKEKSDVWMDVFVLQGEFVERLFRGGSDLAVMAAIGFDWCRHRCGCGLKVFVVKISAHLQRKGCKERVLRVKSGED